MRAGREEVVLASSPARALRGTIYALYTLDNAKRPKVRVFLDHVIALLRASARVLKRPSRRGR